MADWKGNARARMKAALVPVLTNAQETADFLEVRGLLDNTYTGAGLTDYYWQHMRQAILVEKRYSPSDMVDALVTELGLRKLVGIEDIRRFKLPD
jgi:hypothetical protein